MVQESSDTLRSRFVLRPNQSGNWRQCKQVFVVIACTTLGVALGFAFMGYWPVLPFAGLEVLVLGIGFWLSAASGRAVEVVSIEDFTITVEKGDRTTRKVWQAPTAWAQVKLQPSRSAWYPSRLVLRSHGQEVVLGEFLVEEERHELASKLKPLLHVEADFQASRAAHE